jgi:hypothetical protein
MPSESKKLKPVVFIGGQYNYHRQNLFQQNLLLKALQVTTDVNELKKMTGLKTVADVYRTLDKLAIRKEYHEALVRNGIDFDTIIGWVKGTAERADESVGGLMVKQRAAQMLMKSLGVDEYRDAGEQAGQNWEDILRQQIENKPKQLGSPIEYEVNVPEMPEDEKAIRDKERAEAKSIYE